MNAILSVAVVRDGLCCVQIVSTQLAKKVLKSEVEVVYVFIPYILPVGYTVYITFPMFKFFCGRLNGAPEWSNYIVDCSGPSYVV